MDRDKSKVIIIDKSSIEESESKCVHKNINKEKYANNEAEYEEPSVNIGSFVKGNSMPDVSVSGVLCTHVPSKKISRTGSPILDWMTLGKPGKKRVLPIS